MANQPTDAQLRAFLAVLDADEATTNVLIFGYVAQLNATAGNRNAFMDLWRTIRTEVQLPVAMDIAVAYGSSPPDFSWDDVFKRVFEVWNK